MNYLSIHLQPSFSGEDERWFLHPWWAVGYASIKKTHDGVDGSIQRSHTRQKTSKEKADMCLDHSWAVRGPFQGLSRASTVRLKFPVFPLRYRSISSVWSSFLHLLLLLAVFLYIPKASNFPRSAPGNTQKPDSLPIPKYTRILKREYLYLPVTLWISRLRGSIDIYIYVSEIISGQCISEIFWWGMTMLSFWSFKNVRKKVNTQSHSQGSK